MRPAGMTASGEEAKSRDFEEKTRRRETPGETDATNGKVREGEGERKGEKEDITNSRSEPARYTCTYRHDLTYGQSL